MAVVIPAYNMGWCVERAIATCCAQTHAPAEVIVVDDGSLDGTYEVVESVARKKPVVRCLRLGRNAGHLGALRHGLRASTSDWAVLLDADDELTPDSIERRLDAATRYRAKAGEWPQLVYGDLYRNQTEPETRTCFKRLEGRVFEFLTRELSLCQTSTIMLGREAIECLGDMSNPYNTYDEIVLAVGNYFPLAHAGVLKFRYGLIEGGRPTLHYFQAMHLNELARRIAQQIAPFRSVSVSESTEDLGAELRLGPIAAINGPPVMAGLFADNAGGVAVLLVNRDYRYGTTDTLRLRTGERLPQHFDAEAGTWGAGSGDRVTLAPGGAQLVSCLRR